MYDYKLAYKMFLLLHFACMGGSKERWNWSLEGAGADSGGTCSSLWSFEPLFLKLCTTELANEHSLAQTNSAVASDLTLCALCGDKEMGVAFTEWVW